MFVSVAVNIPSEKIFSYAVPHALQKEITTGKRVLIPFGKRRLTGHIVEISNVAPCENIKEIIEILDPEPLFNESDLQFYRWVSRYYIYPLGKALSEILPGGINPKSDRWVTAVKERKEIDEFQMSATQQSVIDTLNRFPSGLSLTRLKKIIGKKDIYRDINILRNTGIITLQDSLRKPDVIPKKEKIVTLNLPNIINKKLTKKQTSLVDFLSSCGSLPVSACRKKFKNILPAIRILEQQGIVCITEEGVSRHHGQIHDIGSSERSIVPNEDQEFAFREILNGLESGRFSPYLLHGVTGSGKTEVYLNAIGETIRRNGGVIILVPEIALTPQLISRFNKRFQDREIAVLHSGVSRAARYDQWRRIQRGEIRIVIGARSAIFAPVRNLKLIIVDEEHDSSYKQDDRMRYNARDLAIMRAKLNAATVIVGSATPAIQTYFNTMKGKYKYLILPRRVEDRPLPEVAIVNMKQEMEKHSQDVPPILSRALLDAINDTLEKKQQTLLFLNRRGFHTFIFCPDCGHTFKCANCAVSMTYHAGEETLKCHYCDFVIKPPASCPGCLGESIRSYGVGTERLEEAVKKYFPHARTGRMDSDTTVKKGAYEKILRALDRQDIDILIGTQMITKGHDFPEVTLVGVISADTSLNIPDFRAGERTFQLLTQVSGRGGRGSSPGRVIIQTFNPDHYAVTMASGHDYLGFYEKELGQRSQLSYPPFSRIINIHLSSPKKDKGTAGIEILRKLIGTLLPVNKLKGRVEVVGPAEAPIAKIKGRHRWQLLLKGEDARALKNLSRELLAKASVTGLDIKVDVDPVNFM